MMNHLSLIIKREFLSRVRNRSFVLMTLLSPVVMVGMVFLIVYLTTLNQDGVKKIGVLDETGRVDEALEDTGTIAFERLSDTDLEAAKIIAQEGGFYGLLHIPPVRSWDELDKQVRLYSDESAHIETLRYIESKLSGRLTNIRLMTAGVDIEKLEASKTKVEVQLENFKGEHTSKMDVVFKIVFGAAAGYLLMMFIIIYGNMVMRSVIEEKTNRIIEVIISSVKPFQLMMGKIIGTSLAGVAQFLTWVLLGGVLLLIASAFLGLPLGETPDQVPELDDSMIEAIIYNIEQLPLLLLTVSFLVFFLGGYFLYSSIYAAIGAAVDSETDTQQFMFPIMVPLMLAMYVGFFSVLDNPHGTVAVVFSYIPLTSPIVMLMRIPFGVAWWEIVLSLVLLFVTFALVVWLAAKIYRVGILMYGKKASYKELIKWVRYS